MLSIQRKKFSLPKDVTYLNCAYMSPLLKEVENKGIEGIKLKKNPFLLSPSSFFEDSQKLRLEFAKLINIRDPSRIAIIPSASYGLAVVAANARMNRAHKMVVAGEQFPSNVYPWMRLSAESGATLKTVSPFADLKDRGKIWNQRILEAIDKSTKLVALGHVHWADGTKFDLLEIRKRTKEVGALLVIDGTQSVGALPFDTSKIQPDALICGGYKWLMGPYSIGMAYFGDYFEDGKPIEENWINRKFSEDFTSLVNYQDEYQPGALRYDVGERSNFILVPMMTAALKQINQWKPENIQGYCASISEKAIQKLIHAGFWIEDHDFRGHHLFGVRLPSGLDLEKIKSRLKKNKISVSFRGNSIRVAPHVYNSEDDLTKLVKVLTA